MRQKILGFLLILPTTSLLGYAMYLNPKILLLIGVIASLACLMAGAYLLLDSFLK